MKVTVIIVHYNTSDALISLLDGIGNTLPCIVIDNASDSPPDVHAYTHVTLIKNSLNRGYATACNQGLMLVQTEWVLFLNPDVTMTTEDIYEFVRQAEEQKFVACSPEPPTQDYKKPLPTFFSLLAEYSPLHRILPLSLFRKKSLFGGAVLIRREVLSELGGWDERFFVWFEDADMTQRLIDTMKSIGWIRIPLKHKGGASFASLTTAYKRSLFFNSMLIYLHSHFTQVNTLILDLLIRRFSSKKLSSVHEDAAGVSLIIPNMRLDLLETFIHENEHVLNKLTEVIVVSSAIYKPEVLWTLRKAYPHIIFVPISQNNGFAHTVNIGFRRSTQSYVATANDDTKLDFEFFNEAKRHLMNHPHTASVNPVIRNPSGEIESAGISILKIGKALPIKDVPVEYTTYVDATNAACVVYARTALQDTGIFDERFGSYLEDIDLSLRLTRKGYNHILLSSHSIIHHGQQTSQSLGAKKQWLDFKNWILIIAKNWSIPDVLLNLSGILLERGRNLNGIVKSI